MSDDVKYNNSQMQRRTKQHAIELRLRCWKLRIKGMEQLGIAKILGVTPQYISKMLKKSGDMYHKEFMDDVKQFKNEQIAQHSHIYAQAMRSWRESKKQGKRKKVKQGATKDATGKTQKSIEAEFTNEEYDQYGNPQYLQTAMKALKSIREITGIDAPIKTQQQHSGTDGQPIAFTVPLLEEQITNLAKEISSYLEEEGEGEIGEPDFSD